MAQYGYAVGDCREKLLVATEVSVRRMSYDATRLPVSYTCWVARSIDEMREDLDLIRRWRNWALMTEEGLRDGGIDEQFGVAGWDEIHFEDADVSLTDAEVPESAVEAYLEVVRDYAHDWVRIPAIVTGHSVFT